MKICPECNGDQYVKNAPCTYVLTCGDCGHVMTVPRPFSITLKLPVLFAQDHIARDLPHGEVLSENNRYVTVRVTTQAVIDEWLGDADYYSNWRQFSEDWETRHSMARSAKRCIEIIKEATS